MTFVAPNLACGEARGGHIPAAGCNRRATKPQAKLGATRRAAGLFGAGFVARSLQTAGGDAARARLPCAKNPWPQTAYFCSWTLSFRCLPDMPSAWIKANLYSSGV